MSPVSANATALPDRRRILSTLAGLGVVGASSLPALASAPNPIEAMWPEYLRLEDLRVAAISRLGKARKRYEELEPLEPPTWKFVGGAVIKPQGGGYHVDISPESIDYLRVLAADTSENGVADEAKATLTEVEAWQAEVDRRRAVTGLDVAEIEEAETDAASHAHRTAMFEIEAETVRELALQAALLEDDWRQDEAERIIYRLVELMGIDLLTQAAWKKLCGRTKVAAGRA